MRPMHWLAERTRLVSEGGYWITCAPMARAYWYNAYAPGGAPIASGQLGRCLEACDKHHGGQRLGERGKRQFRPVAARGRKVALLCRARAA